MSRRFRWRAARTGSGWAALLDLAARAESGALEFPAASAAVYLTEGQVAQVVSPGVPALEARRGHERRAVVADAAADAALDIVTRGAEETRFVEGRAHAAPLEPPWPAQQLLAEVARRRRVLTAIAGRAGPDEPVRRATHLPVDTVRLTARHWNLVRLADGTRTPRTMATELGEGVFATTVEVAALVQAQVLAGERAAGGNTFLSAVNET